MLTRGQDHGVALRDAVKVWMRVAILSFGGPAGQIAVMHRILVQELRWISDARFLEPPRCVHLQWREQYKKN